MAAQNSDNGISGDGVFTSFLSGSSLHPTSGTSPKYDSIKMSFGSNLYHNNIAPAIASYIWKRTAQSVGELATDKLQIVAIESGSRTSGSVQGNFTIIDVWQNKKLGASTSGVDSYGLGYLTTNGRNKYHNNLPPALAVYGWKRLN